ncbi:hypothetical protein ACJIZ3_000946 [Penstemon smallii]|uniref:Homeobox protein knotted-1-like 1 n=1 Tax=Penstemon smallii TaxID=265156 RepID=A0ABD3U5S2_9LAMI
MDDDDDELYRFHYSSISSSCPFGDHVNNNTTTNNSSSIPHHQHHHQISETSHHELTMSDIIKAQIASHPLYPNLLSAYIECRKVGAAEEMALLLEEISRENRDISSTCSEIGADPELDEFMKSYCEVLHKYREEVSKPFDEATSFLSSIESELTNLCKQTLIAPAPGCPSDEDMMMSCGELEEEEEEVMITTSTSTRTTAYKGRSDDQELKEMLMRKYSGYLSNLKKDFLKKRKKGKLPKGATTALLDWWNTHYRWPYPTEEEKNRLSDITGLDQKQINNWFINQRKRHWRPSEDMRFALMEGVSGGAADDHAT